ncbi:serine/threonine-protein kinase [Paraliomyxa miuraensis]|uniref:serine/threonine-protein kinase n=1 Tax=Paraliomyxa miuraensis TaxID=376150 RepID=UPI002253AE00|nr:serine/threonine protein kinase [Paraliomyxa miuraensis]MCX4239731.1 protein kinase [Paraliomyxa miuraensis]
MRQDLQVPRQLGEFRLIRLLGRGGMGEVWLARKEGLDTPCVVKVLLPQFASDPERVRFFHREAEVLSKLGHGRIISIIGSGEQDGWLYIAMSFVDGVDLGTFCRALAKNGELMPVIMAAYIIGEVLEGLRHAHERAPGGNRLVIIHRDVTPGNVMISSEGEVFLTDFGLARGAEGVSVDVFGTLEYMAPEQAKGRACPQSDLYSVGCLLFFMLTGRPPRRPRDISDLQKPLTEAELDLGRTDVPEPLVRLIHLCLAFDPAERIETALDALRLLAEHGLNLRETILTATLYQENVGPKHTGLTGVHAAADEPSDADEAKGPTGTVRADAPAVAASSAEPLESRPPKAPTGTVVLTPPAAVVDESEPTPPPMLAEPATEAEVISPPGVEPSPAEEAEHAGESSELDWKPWWEEEADDGTEEAATRQWVEPDAPRLFRRPRKQTSPPAGIERAPTPDRPEQVPVRGLTERMTPPSTGRTPYRSTPPESYFEHEPLPPRVEPDSAESQAGESPKVVVGEAPGAVTTPAGPQAAWMQTARPVAEVVVKAWLAAALLVGLGFAAGVVLSGRQFDARSKPEAQPAREAAAAFLEEAPPSPPDPEVSASVRAQP